MSIKPTPRTQRAYKTHHVTRRTAQIECLNCSAMHTVDVGDDRADVDFVPCQGSDSCESMLCQDCRHKCTECGLWACYDHMGWFIGERVCHLCLAKLLDEMGEPECQCMRIDVDLDDASQCPIHGRAA